MENRPIRDERILEAIEACRPGSDDVADPALAYLAAELEADAELASLYERLQQVDGLLAAKFRDVPVPEGLQQRLLDRLAAARAERLAEADFEKATKTLAEDRLEVSPPRQRRISRRVSRRWLAAGLALTSAAVVLVAVTLRVLFQGTEPYTRDQVLQIAQRFFTEESPQPGFLLADPNHPPPGDYPISTDVLQPRGVQWRPISGLLDRDGAAYDMPGGRATLYVVRLTVADLPSQPPLKPGRTTGGYCTSAWQVGDLLYVLVVQGDGNSYRRRLAPLRPMT